MKEKLSKEIINIAKALEAYKKKHKGNVVYECNISAFDEENEVIDDRVFAYGNKKIVLIGVDGSKKQIKEEKDKFINW